MHRCITPAAVSLCALLAAGAAHSLPGADAPSSAASSSHGPSLPTKPVLTLEAAEQLAHAGLDKARSLDAHGAIAVVDDGGHLICLVRIDGTFPAASEVAEAKARTAAIFQHATQDFENAVKSGRNTLLAVGPMTPLEGGVPVVVDGQIIGAVGVSGAHSSSEDVIVATAAAAGFGPPE